MFTLAGFIPVLVLAGHGLGRHQSTLTHAEVVRLNLLTFVNTILARTTGINLVKISIALSLCRLIQTQLFRYTIWAMIIFLVLWTVVGYIVLLLRCVPLRYAFDKSIDGHCYPDSIFAKLAFSNTCALYLFFFLVSFFSVRDANLLPAINILTDILCATLPVPVIWKLRMRLRTRVYLVAIFSMGYM